MEITFEEPYEDNPYPRTEKRILLSLNSEKFNRKPPPQAEAKKPRHHYESPPSPISLEEENRQYTKEDIQVYRFPISKFSPSSSSSSKFSQIDFMHNKLQRPDFAKISQIYSAHNWTPESINRQRPNHTPNRNSMISRPSSVPLSKKNIVQDLIKERESEFKKTCTFKPEINRSYVNKKMDYNDSGSEVGLRQRILKLSRPKSETVEKREKMKRELEEMKYSECTFKPVITAYKGLNKSFSDFPVEERLYQDAEVNFNERERMQREKEEEFLARFPFRPQVQGTVSKLIGSQKEKPPIYQRLQELQSEIQQNRNNIRLEAEKNDPNLTFKPKINPNSSYLAHMKKQRASSVHRNESCERSKRHSAQLSYEEKYTFTPHISYLSTNTTGQEFLDRQKSFQARAQAKKEEFIEKLQQNTYNFTPEIDRVSKFIVENNRDRSAGKVEDRVDQDLEKSRHIKAKLEEKYYGIYKFEPNINQISKTIARSTSLNDISNNTFTLAMKKKLAEDKAADEERKNSFTPKLIKPKKFEYITSSYKQGEYLSNTIKLQSENLNKKREIDKKSREYEEMRECTFVPQYLNNSRSSFNDSRVIVKGLERFFELRNIARRKQEESKERERRVFLQSPKRKIEPGFTTPVPFNIHPSNKKQKIDKVREEMMRKEQAECVFKPALTK